MARHFGHAERDEKGRRVVPWWISIVAVFAVLAALGAMIIRALPRDLDGRHANSPLKPWFEQLQSKKSRCCDDADGRKVEDVDWTPRGKRTDCVELQGQSDGEFCVRLYGKWYLVPEDALVTEPNRAGVAVVWPVQYSVQGRDPQVTNINCFMPGTEG